MTTQCPSCGCHQPDSLLCWEDTAAYETMLRAVPALLDELQIAIAKQAKVSVGGKAGKGTAREKSPINFGALAVRDALLVELALWGTDVDAVRKHPQAAEILSGLGRAIKDAYRCIDRMADRKYLGLCNAPIDGGVCTAELWAKPGAHQTKCQQCGYVHDVGDRRGDMLEQARDMLFTVKEASMMVGEVGEIRVTEASIRGYIHRGRIAYHSGKMIRLGDLLAVVLDESERRAS